ncbi:hypothetical protein RB598_000238 [Gaeumannomyces tritici]
MARLTGSSHVRRPQVLFLPEASDYIAENREQSLALARPESSSPFAAREHDVDVNVGIHTCFDLRFPEPALAPARWGGDQGPAQVLTHPSAFTVPTGLAHWEVLLRSRRSASWSPPPRSASTATGPGRAAGSAPGAAWPSTPGGRVLCALPGVGAGGEVPEAAAAPALGVFDVDLGEWERVRDRMPLVRRTDVYPEL